ncbi:MAG: class F sortase [Microcoleus sp.]
MFAASCDRSVVATNRRRLAVVFVAVALCFGLAACQTESVRGTPAGVGQEIAPPQPSPTTTTTLPSRAQPSESPATAIPAPKLVSVPAVPLRLSVPRIGLRAAIEKYTDEMVKRAGGVDPPKLDAVSWWTGGGTPGTDSNNTTYLYGHTWIEPAVFNRIKELVPGDDIFVTTSNGRLRYVVEGSYQVTKPELPNDPRVTAIKPGRLLLLGCWRASGKELVTTKNVVVQAQIVP